MQTKPKAVDSPHLFPGETADDAEYEHRVDKDEWLDRLDAAAQADMDEEYQNIYEGYGYDDGLLPE